MFTTAAERQHVYNALVALERDDVRRFEDCLWLAFGDRWTAVQQRLVLAGLIAPRGGAEPSWAITARGRGYVVELSDQPEKAAG